MLALPFPSCRTLGKLLKHSEPHFPHQQNGDNSSICVCVRMEQNSTWNSGLHIVSITLALTTIAVFILGCYVTNTQLENYNNYNISLQKCMLLYP